MDLSAIEGRFKSVVGDVDSALHSQIAREVFAAATAILSLFPEGSVVENILTKLDELASEAHTVAETVTAPASGPTVVTPEGKIVAAPSAVPSTTPAVTEPEPPAAPPAEAAPVAPEVPGAPGAESATEPA